MPLVARLWNESEKHQIIWIHYNNTRTIPSLHFDKAHAFIKLPIQLVTGYLPISSNLRRSLLQQCSDSSPTYLVSFEFVETSNEDAFYLLPFTQFTDQHRILSLLPELIPRIHALLTWTRASQLADVLSAGRNLLFPTEAPSQSRSHLSHLQNSSFLCHKSPGRFLALNSGSLQPFQAIQQKKQKKCKKKVLT